MPRSFDIALFSGLYLVAVIIILSIGIFPFSWDMLWVIVPALFGFGLSWIVKKVEKIERNWDK